LKSLRHTRRQHLTRSAATIAATVAVGLGVLGATAPAQAATITQTASQVTMGTTVGLHTTPRLNTPTTGQLYAGDQATAYCAFENGGTGWVKIQLNDETRFVQRSGVASGADTLPSTCPNEVETVERVAFTMKFGSPAWGVPLEGFTCPAAYPYLDARVKVDWHPYFDSVWGIDQFWGLTVKRPVGIGIDLGIPLKATAPDGATYLSGYTGGTASNHYAWDESVTITASCTNNLAYAKKSA
jgi:hypothetical protein